MLGGSTALILLGLPVAFCFLIIDIIGAAIFLGGSAGLDQFIRESVSAVANFSLTPIPLFILMGEVLFHTGLAVKVIDSVDRVLAKVPGRLSVVAIVAGTIFSAISGSTIAITAMLGGLMVPLMLARGYHPVMATGPIMAIGAVDILMPVSALTVLLGSLSGISIPKLLIGSFVPELILKIAFIVYIIVRVKAQPSLAPVSQSVGYGRWEKVIPLIKYVLPVLLIFAGIVTSMSAGWATPTESAALGAFLTIVLTLSYGVLKPPLLMRALLGTVEISAMILFIIFGAVTFSQLLSFSGASDGLVGVILAPNLSPFMIVAAMMFVLLVLGFFVDQVSMMLITLPIFMPIVQKLEINQVWFGVMFLICMQLGLLLPPHGLLLMTMKGVVPAEVTINHIFRAVTPYVIMSVVLLFIVFMSPEVATWLPTVLIRP